MDSTQTSRGRETIVFDLSGRSKDKISSKINDRWTLGNEQWYKLYFAFTQGTVLLYGKEHF